MTVVRRRDILRSDAVIERLGLQGIGLPPRPEGDRPHIPSDLTAIDDVTLMDLFARLNAWHGYIATRAAIAAIDEKDAQDQADVEDAKAMVRNWSGATGEKVTIARAQRDADPQVIAKKDVLLERYATRKLTETLAATAERDVFLVSREITRRTGGQSSGMHSRASRWSA